MRSIESRAAWRSIGSGRQRSEARHRRARAQLAVSRLVEAAFILAEAKPSTKRGVVMMRDYRRPTQRSRSSDADAWRAARAPACLAPAYRRTLSTEAGDCTSVSRSRASRLTAGHTTARLPGPCWAGCALVGSPPSPTDYLARARLTIASRSGRCPACEIRVPGCRARQREDGGDGRRR